MRAAAAAGVLVAALLVLLAAGGPRPHHAAASVLHPVDPSEVVPASLSRGAVVNWALADRTLQAAADRVAACEGTQRCVAHRLAAFTASSRPALADARQLSGAQGSCGRAFESYAAQVNQYGAVARELAATTHTTPGLAGSLRHLRTTMTFAVELVWHYCRRGA